MLVWVIDFARLVNNNNKECSPKNMGLSKYVHLVPDVDHVYQLGHLHRVPLGLIYFQ